MYEPELVRVALTVIVHDRWAKKNEEPILFSRELPLVVLEAFQEKKFLAKIRMGAFVKKTMERDFGKTSNRYDIKSFTANSELLPNECDSSGQFKMFSLEPVRQLSLWRDTTEEELNQALEWLRKAAQS